MLRSSPSPLPRLLLLAVRSRRRRLLPVPPPSMLDLWDRVDRDDCTDRSSLSRLLLVWRDRGWKLRARIMSPMDWVVSRVLKVAAEATVPASSWVCSPRLPLEEAR